LPANYTAASDITATVYWAPETADVGNLKWILQNVGLQANNSEIVGGVGLSPEVNVAAPGVALALMSSQITISGTGLAAGDLLQLRLEYDKDVFNKKANFYTILCTYT
jgi:hypothetical protein